MGRAENRRQVKNLKSKSLSVQAREHQLSKCPLNWREVMEGQCVIPKEKAPVGVGAPNESKQKNLQEYYSRQEEETQDEGI